MRNQCERLLRLAQSLIQDLFLLSPGFFGCRIVIRICLAWLMALSLRPGTS